MNGGEIYESERVDTKYASGSHSELLQMFLISKSDWFT